MGVGGAVGGQGCQWTNEDLRSVCGSLMFGMGSRCPGNSTSFASSSQTSAVGVQARFCPPQLDQQSNS